MSHRLPGIRPRQSIWLRLDAFARSSFPGAATVLLLLVVAAPLGLPGQAQLLVATSLASVFFWSLFRPSSMAPPQVFAIGLLVDLLGFAPVGVNVLTLLATHGLAMLWRRFLTRQGFFLVWLAFIVITVGAAVLQWLMTCVLTLALLPPWPVLFQAALAAGLYPLLAVLLTRAHQSLGQAEGT